MSDFSMDTEKSTFMIDGQNKQLIVKISDINFVFGYYFDCWTEPEWLKDQGNSNIVVTNATILLNLLPSNKDGVLQIDFSETKIDVEDYKVNINGNSDLSKAT